MLSLKIPEPSENKQYYLSSQERRLHVHIVKESGGPHGEGGIRAQVKMRLSDV